MPIHYKYPFSGRKSYLIDTLYDTYSNNPIVLPISRTYYQRYPMDGIQIGRASCRGRG